MGLGLVQGAWVLLHEETPKQFELPLIKMSQKVHLGDGVAAFAFRHPVVINPSDNLRPLSSVQFRRVALWLLFLCAGVCPEPLGYLFLS